MILARLGFVIVGPDDAPILETAASAEPREPKAPKTASPRLTSQRSSVASARVADRGSNGLKVALVVPFVHSRTRARSFPVEALKRDIAAGAVEVVVFPEMHCDATVEQAQSVVDAEARALGCPVLMGVWASGAYQTAFYSNPFAKRGETSSHRYFKHATSERLAYEWPGYKQHRDEMFAPIRLRGTSIGVQLCHDMFFGLVSARLRAEGAEVLVDLTGSNVNGAKWTNVLRGRSIEHGCPMLCTISDTEGKTGLATALAFSNGRKLHAEVNRLDGRHGSGGYAVFDTNGNRFELEPDASTEQSYSDKVYDTIRIGLGSSRKDLDVSVTIAAGKPVIAGARPASVSAPGWVGFETRAGRLGVLGLSAASLRDPTAILRMEPTTTVFSQHVVVYVGGPDDELSHDEIVCMLRLRAIEHRMAVGYLSPSIREMIKTNRYKNIQRFAEQDGVFGLDGMFMGGTFSSASADASGLGIPDRYIAQYLSLMG